MDKATIAECLQLCSQRPGKTGFESPCRKCPVNAVNMNDYVAHCHEMYAEAAALLKAQEPRLMTLEEVLDLKYDDVVYLEDFPTKSVFSAIVIEVVPKLPDIDIGIVQFRFAPTWNGINNADLSYYGKVWRVWTSRPTPEQREATPWN